MSIVHDAPAAAVPGTAQQEDVQPQSTAAESTALITEHEMAFVTATARGLPKEDHRWAVFRRIVAALAFHSKDAAAQDDSGPRYRHYPRRMAYLDDARMQREMLRL